MTRTQSTVYRLFILLIVLVLSEFFAGVWRCQTHWTRCIAPLHVSWGDIAILTGFIACGAYIAAISRPDRKLRYESLFVYTVWGWIIYVVVTIILGIIHYAPTLALVIIQFVLLAIFTILTLISAYKSPFTQIWGIGMVIFVGAEIMHVLEIPHLHQQLTYTLAYPLMTLAIGFWLITRFSNMAYGWVKDGLYILAVLVSVAGILLIFLPGWGTNSLAFIIYGMIAARSYRALTRHNDGQTLAAHWYAFSVIVLWIGILPIGFGAMDLAAFLMTFAALSMILAGVNQSVAEMRSINRRITGLLPFWCIVFGVIALGYVLSVDSILSGIVLDEPALEPIATPMNQIVQVSQVSIFLGMIFYALGFWARRIK